MIVLATRFVWNAGAAARIEAAIHSAGGALLSLNRGLDVDEACAYIDAKAAQAESLRAALGAIVGNISLVEPELIQEVPDTSAGATATVYDVVETDVLPEAEADCAAWYFEEHLPGLASVPGAGCRVSCVPHAIATPAYSTPARAPTPAKTSLRAIPSKARRGSKYATHHGSRGWCRRGGIP